MIKEGRRPETTEEERCEYGPERAGGAGGKTAAEPTIEEIKAKVTTSRIEEVKSLFAEKVRADSRDSLALSSAAALDALAPEMQPAEIAAVLDAMRIDERYADIRAVTSSTGDVYYHSDRHMSGYYAIVLTRVLAKDPCATIAATVRDESRRHPRPTCVLAFMQSPFQIPPCDLRSVVDDMLRKPEFADIKMMVHPTTGGVYLYSSRFLTEDTAWSLMDWQEVVKVESPQRSRVPEDET